MLCRVDKFNWRISTETALNYRDITHTEVHRCSSTNPVLGSVPADDLGAIPIVEHQTVLDRVEWPLGPMMGFMMIVLLGKPSNDDTLIDVSLTPQPTIYSQRRRISEYLGLFLEIS